MDLFASRWPKSTEPAKVGKDAFLGIIWGGVAISFLFVVMRLAARWATFKKLFFDDVFVILAWFLALGTAVDWQRVAWKMYQFMALTSGQLWPPPSTFVADTESYYDGSLAVLFFYYSSLWAVKVAFLLFFRRLGHNVRGQKILWWSISGLTVATYFVCIADIQYSCLVSPLPKILATCSSEKNVQFQTATLKLNCALDVITDFMIMTIPISMLWQVQMSIRKKLALTGIFSLVVITMVIAVVRVAVISALTRQPDTSWSYMWSSIEQCIAIIVSCLGSFRALFSRQNSRKPAPQRSLIHASRNLFLHGPKRFQASDQSISLSGLRGDSSHYSTYIRTSDTKYSADHLNECENGHARPSNSVLVKREYDVGHVDRETQTRA